MSHRELPETFEYPGHYRYLAECATGDAKGKAAEGACVAHAEATKTLSQDRTLQCTAEQILDVPVPEMAKQLVEVPETVSQDRIQQRTVEQTIPAISLVETIVEVPVIQKQGRTQQAVNTFIQHAVNTVEVEGPQIMKQTWQKPIIQDKINQVTRHVEVPQVQFLNKVDEMPTTVSTPAPTPSPKSHILVNEGICEIIGDFVQSPNY